MKSIFFTGKGGSGKTTLSVAFSIYASSIGKVLTSSLDPAHNLKDVLEQFIPKKHRKSVKWVEVDWKSYLKKYLRQFKRSITDEYPFLKVVGVDEFLKVVEQSPEAMEFSVLMYVESVFLKNKFDFAVFDMPPSGLSFRVLSLADTTQKWLSNLMNFRKKMESLAEATSLIKGSSPSRSRLTDELEKRIQRYSKLSALLKSSAVVIVDNCDAVSVKEADALEKDLTELGFENVMRLKNKCSGGIKKFDTSNPQMWLDVGERIYKAIFG